MSMVLRASSNQFSAQARIFIHFKHVNARMRDNTRDGFLQGELPALGCLVWKTCDQIHINIRDSHITEACNIVEHDGARMQPPYSAGFLIDKRLNPQAHAIHSDASETFHDRRS